MKPTNDIFEQQVRGLYEGYEVPAPASTKDAVFKELDSATGSAGSGLFASKSLLIAASLLTLGAIYMLTNDTPPVQDPAQPAVVLEDAETVPTVNEIATEVEEIAVEETVIKAPVVIEEIAEGVVETSAVIEPVEEKVILESPVVEEIKEVAPPVEVVEPVATETPTEEKKEEVEWVLPATIKVEK